MKIFKDEKKLDRDYPFAIERYLLSKADNEEDTFHFHDFCEITYIESGRGMYCVNGSEYRVNPGDIIIFNNVEPHGWYVEEDMEVLVLIFSLDLVSDPANLYTGDYLKPFIERGSNFRNLIEALDDNNSIIYDMMRDIYKENADKKTGYINIVRADVLRILIYLIRLYQKDEYSIEDRIGERRQAIHRLSKAFEFINDHFTENITLEEVSSKVYMSPNYFSTYFRNITGHTFSTYITIMRLKKARTMLVSTDHNVTEVALECGFRNMSNFYRLYKKYLGELPKRNNIEVNGKANNKY